jgi:hypothetical protein
MSTPPRARSVAVVIALLAQFSDALVAGHAGLYAVLLLTDVVGLALVIRSRRRRSRRAAARAWTEPLDLETLKARMHIADDEPRTRQLPQTRELLEELRRREATSRISGVAGSSRRR